VRIILIILSWAVISCNQKQERIWVLDNEHDLTDAQVSRLDSLYKAHERKTGNEIALVTTPDYFPDTDIISYSTTVFRKYGFGKKDRNNGVVIVYSNGQHEVRIATGSGTERVLKDHIAKGMIDNIMIPSFKDERIFDGLWNGSMAITAFLERPENKIK
jgi:uncharacterized protein